MDDLSSFFESVDSIDINTSETQSAQSNDYNELIERLLKHYLRYKISLVQLEDLAKLLNSVPKTSVRLPTTKYLLTKEFSKLCSLECYRHITCSNCKTQNKKNFFSNDALICQCGEQSKLSEDNHFITFNIEQQIKNIFCNNFNRIKTSTIFVNDNISDSVNELINEITKKNGQFLSLTINTDGVSLQKSNTFSLWPIQLICNFLPAEIRYDCKNIIVAGLYYGKTKPNFLTFFEPLAKEMNHLQSTGLFFNDQYFPVFISHASMDLPAKAEVQNNVHHNGFYACMYCHHPGETVNRTVRFTFRKNPYLARTHSEMIKLMNLTNTHNVCKSGIKGISPIVAFKHFNSIWSFSIDYMHNVLLGRFMVKSILAQRTILSTKK